MKYEDLTGRRFGRLVVVSRHTFFSATGKKLQGWLCKCDCGGMSKVITHDLKSGHTRSCGCGKRIATLRRNTTHGLSKVPEYKVWKSIKNRTGNINEPAYARYGGRGIVMYPAWKEDFSTFYAYMGERPSDLHSVERINNDLGYEPGNVVWALPKDQANNRSSNINVEFNGKLRTVKQWCDDLNLDIAYATVKSRIKRGWPPERAFYQPTGRQTTPPKTA